MVQGGFGKIGFVPCPSTDADSRMMDEDKITLAKIETQLEGLVKTVEDLKKSFDQTVVTRNEWQQRNLYVDSKLEENSRDITDLKTSRGAWWIWVMAAFAAITLAWNLLSPIVTATVAR